MRVSYGYKLKTFLLVAGMILFVSLSARGNEEKEAGTLLSRHRVIREDDIVFGNRESPVVVIEYFSPTCRHCALMHKKIFPVLREKYISADRIAYVMREFIGNKQDLDAAILARCSDNGSQYLKFMERILESQEAWAYGADYRKKLEQIAINVGVSADQYRKCLADDALINIFFENTKLAASKSGFIGTPTFVINGDLHNITSKEEIFTAIEEAMKNHTRIKTVADYVRLQIAEAITKSELYAEVEEVLAEVEELAREVNSYSVLYSG